MFQLFSLAKAAVITLNSTATYAALTSTIIISSPTTIFSTVSLPQSPATSVTTSSYSTNPVSSPGTAPATSPLSLPLMALPPFTAPPPPPLSTSGSGCFCGRPVCAAWTVAKLGDTCDGIASAAGLPNAQAFAALNPQLGYRVENCPVSLLAGGRYCLGTGPELGAAMPSTAATLRPVPTMQSSPAGVTSAIGQSPAMGQTPSEPMTSDSGF